MDVITLRKYCTKSPRYFLGDKDYKFYDNGASILAVAHVDTVKIAGDKFGVKNHVVYSPALDDRLGVYTLMEVLPRYCEFDLLLTTDEEIGQSTAAMFETDKQYNWMFSFDRRGTGAVLYDYEFMDDWYTATSYKFKIQIGSFSDISYLTHLGICGINVGTGYHDEHTSKCHLNVNEWHYQVQDFIAFYDNNKAIRYPYEHQTRYKWEDRVEKWGKWDDLDYCEICGQITEDVTHDPVSDLYICPACVDSLSDARM